MEQMKISEYDIKNLEPLKSLDGESFFDYDKYHMQNTEIEKVAITESNVGYVNNKRVELDEPRPQLLVESKILETKKDKDGEDIELRAREWFNLIKKSDGQICWSTHEKAKLNKFLSSMRVKAPAGLVGKKVIVKVESKEDSEGNKKQYLRFVY